MLPGDPMPFDLSKLSPDTFVGEVVMKQEITALLSAARSLGCPIQPGIDMLYEQIPAYLEFFGLPTTTPDKLRALARVAY
jgi:shikimate dehydrogenase